MTRRTRLPALVAGTAIVAAALACATPANAADGDVDKTMCLGTDVWTGDLVKGQPLTGLTTDDDGDGATPSKFQGEFISQIDDAFGNDIYLVKLRGSRITKGDGSIDAGIWSGISGSPVYDADNNLVGSVSYGFTDIQGSDIAGVTPAANIFATKLGAEEPETQASVSVSKAERTTVARTGSKAGSSLKRLELPKVAVGASSQARAHGYFAGKARSLSNRSTDFGTAGVDENAGIIEAGHNIATSWSSGDLLFASVGTVTAVCEDAEGKRNQVFAYGHPDEDLGDSQQSIHAATTTAIIANGGNSYKMVNVDPVSDGALVNDGTNGVYGVLGQDPEQDIPVTTRTTYGSKTAEHTTSVSEPDALSTVVATQIYGETAAVLGNSSGAGAGKVTWDISYEREDSSTGTFSREQFISSKYEFGYDVLNEVASDVDTLQLGSDENITVTGVDIRSNLTSRYYKGLKVSSIQVKSGSTWKPVAAGSTIKVKKGARLDYRVLLTPDGNSSTSAKRTVGAPGFVTTKKFGSTGSLRVFGALADDDYDEEYYYDDEEFYFDDEEEDYFESLPFEEILELLESPLANNSLLGQLRQSAASSKPDVKATPITTSPAVVTGSKTYKLSFTK